MVGTFVRRCGAVLFASGLMLSVAAPQPARADDLGDMLLGALIEYAGLDPDAIELIRYTIRAPQHAAVVFSHAASYDIPFFAIVGAVKAMKNRSIGGIVFDEGVCLTPVTVIDDVFGASSSYIDDAAAKVKTDGIVGQAKQFGVQYAQAQNEAAKQEVLAQLTANVPYFGELPTICDFAFHTDLKVEKNVQQSVSVTVVSLRNAYNAFADGEIGDGVEHLIKAGIADDVACAMADSAVSGGFIGKTPILGDIAMSACKGFAGTVIKGIASGAEAVVEAGAEFFEDAACAVADLFDACESATPPPPTGIGNATAFCAPFGGIQSAMSKTNAPDDYSVVCNDGSACRAKPGQPVACLSGARRALNEWARNFVDAWSGKCQDDQCRAAMPVIRDDGFAAGIETIAAEPTVGWPAVRATAIAAFEEKAASEVAASAQRIAALNQEITSSAAEGWEILFVAVYGKQCWDQQCRDEVAALAAEFKTALVAAQIAEPGESALTIQGKVGKVYGPKFAAIVKASDKRRIVADPNSSAAQKLAALDCKLFLGRPDQWLCPGGNVGFDICVGAVKAGTATLCYTTVDRAYGTKETTTSVVKSQKCEPMAQPEGATGLAFLCVEDKGRSVCERFIKGGMDVACNAMALVSLPPPVLAMPPLPPQPAPPAGVPVLPLPAQPFAVTPLPPTVLPVPPPVQAMVPPPLPVPNPALALPAPPVPVAPLALPGGLRLVPPPESSTAVPLPQPPTPPAPPIAPMIVQPQLTLPGIALALPPAEIPADDPAALGCNERNTGEWICPDARGFAACVARVRAGDGTSMCVERDNGARYGTERQVVAYLSARGCQGDGTPLGFACETPEAIGACQQFGTGGMQVSCKPVTLALPPQMPVFQIDPGMFQLPRQ